MAYTSVSDNVRVYGDDQTGVWVAPKGTTLPTDLTTDPGAGFKALGWLSAEGIALNVDKDIKEFNALQAGALVRTKVGKVVQKFTFTCYEDTATILGLMFSGQTFTKVGTGSAAHAEMNFGANQNATTIRAFVVDAVDGAYRDRYIISAGDCTFTGEVFIAKNDDLRQVKFEVKVIADAVSKKLTNSPGVMAELS